VITHDPVFAEAVGGAHVTLERGRVAEASE
jgi:hypothetical protein